MKLLFITWDGPQVHYMEGLFFPIFNEIQKRYPVDFHILQFIWNNREGIERTKKKANELGLRYRAEKVYRKPHPIIGSLVTIIRGRSVIKNYINNHNIDVLMPRNIFPAIMTNLLSKKDKDIPIIFDADGLQIDEKIEFGGLSENSLQCKFLRFHESKIMEEADRIITRSKKSIDIRENRQKSDIKSKSFVVPNGRNINHFKPEEQVRLEVRSNLGISKDSTIFVYCGSLGEQYCVDEMLEIFSRVSQGGIESRFLILTGSPEYLEAKIPTNLESNVIVKSVPFEEVPNYLNAADIAFAIRKPSFSMKGVAPVKLGEYLLMGLPTIASTGIGDTVEILKEAPGCFLYDHDDKDMIKKTVSWITDNVKPENKRIRNFAMQHFSLESSAESYIKVFESLEN